MILGLEIGMLIAGIVALVKGTFQLSKNRVVDGTPARIIGVTFLLPLPLALLLAVVIIAQAPNGAQATIGKTDVKWVLVEAGIAIGVFLIGILIAAFTSHERREKKRRYDDQLEEEDEAPRRARKPLGKPVGDTGIAARCPGCGQSFSLAASLAGKKVRCKACREVFRVEAPPQEEAIYIADVVAEEPPKNAVKANKNSYQEPLVADLVPDEEQDHIRPKRKQP